MSPFDQMVLACRPARIADYPPERRAVWEQLVKQTGTAPSIYPGSIFRACEECGIEVAVGPRQQSALARGSVTVLCMLCAALYSREPNVEATLMNLGNPFKRKP